MAFLSQRKLGELGFKSLGRGVLVSEKASIYYPNSISIGDYSRIDDFCLLSGNVVLGRNVHLAAFTNIAGGTEGVYIEDFSGVAYGSHVISQSDDYTGHAMTNPTIPSEFTLVTRKRVTIKRHSIIGTNSVILPGVELAEGTAVGALSVVKRSTEEWGIYVGNPAQRVAHRSRNLLLLEAQFLKTNEFRRTDEHS